MKLAAVPQKPVGVETKVARDFTKEYVVPNSYSLTQQKILSNTIDDVETEVSFRAYDKMENDSTITKIKQILVTSVLADDLQFAPGSTEEQVGAKEYETYVQVMELCERTISGLDKPYRDTMQQLFGNSIKYGHGVAEVEFEYRRDAPSSNPKKDVPVKGRLSSMWSGFSNWWKGNKLEAAEEDNGSGTISKPVLSGEKTRLMPSGIKVKPRNSTRFVVDDFMNVLGLAPANKAKAGLKWDEIVDRDKFLVLTLNKQDEDPRGRSLYRPAFNWWNIKSQLPAEILRFILEESVPKAVGTLPPDMPAFEFERDSEGNIVYDDPDTKKIPRMKTGAESFKGQIEGFRSGSGAVIPHGATLKPYKQGLTGTGDAAIWPVLMKVLKNEMEESVLLQTLAQSEGEHQARSASEQVAEVLYNLVFWIRWQISMVTLIDLCSVTVRMNLGEWALRYMPLISLGDFVRRDWVSELDALSNAYFQGFIDDSQRAELMSWLNMPKPGPSRQELGLEAAAKQDVNGQPSQPNTNRPDKQAGTDKRNENNGTEKKKNVKQNTGRGPINPMGNNTRWFRRFTSGVRTSGN